MTSIPEQRKDRIPIFGNGGVITAWTLIDPEDFEKCSNLRWNLGSGGYAIHSKTIKVAFRKYKRKTTRLHRLILGDPKGLVDHINHDTLDNRKINLRLCTHAENMRNRKGLPTHNTSGALGVYWVEDCHAWKVLVGVDGNHIYFGLFTDKQAAIQARDEAAKLHHGEFAALNETLNIPDSQSHGSQ